MAAGLIAVALAFAAGVVAGRAWHRRARAAPAALTPLPAEALRWLREAQGALGAWAILPDAEAADTDPRLDAEQAARARARVVRAAGTGGRSAEPLGEGRLLVVAAEGAAVGLLLPAGRLGERAHRLDAELRALLTHLTQGARWQAIDRVDTGDGRRESLASAATRLAFQLEQAAGTPALVLVREPGGCRVAGLSLRADRRHADLRPQVGSAAEQAATAGRASREPLADPLGEGAGDRRRSGWALVRPLLDADAPIGAVVLWLDDPRQATPSLEAAVAQTLSVAGRFVGLARSTDLARREALTDPLTGLWNRRGLAAEQQRAGHRTGALIYLDLDRFKSLNDTLGHPAGDAALVHVARLLPQEVRAGDIVARLGGEEFALWLPGARLQRARDIAERLRTRLAATPWGWQGRPWPLTASFGLAATPETSPTLEALPEQADAALYAAKAGGRNRVEVAGGDRQEGGTAGRREGPGG